MDFRKNLYFYIIAIVCVVLFGYWYLERISPENRLVFMPNNGNEETQTGDTHTIMVYVSGNVNTPGVFAVETGSRVSDAIELAGGVTSDANTELIDMAALVYDGQTIHVPAKGEDIPQPEDKRINLNTATAEELTSLSGIGKVTAEEIIKYREQTGGFAQIEDIMNVKGIGEKTFERLRDYIKVSN